MRLHFHTCTLHFLLSTIAVIFALFNGHWYSFVVQPPQLVCMWVCCVLNANVSRFVSKIKCVDKYNFPNSIAHSKQKQKQSTQCPQHVYKGFQQIKSLTMLTNWLGKCLRGINSHSCALKHRFSTTWPPSCTRKHTHRHTTQWRCSFLLLTHSTLKKHNFRQKSHNKV